MVGTYDFDITVDEDGSGTSALQDTYRLVAFAVKCEVLSVWEFDIIDQDGYPVYSSDGIIGVTTGPSSIPVNRRCQKFRIILKNATPGTYNVRASVD